MSFIGDIRIIVPPEVAIFIDENRITMKGPQGSITKSIPQHLLILYTNHILCVVYPRNLIKYMTSSLSMSPSIPHWGILRSSLSHMLYGVTRGFRKRLRLIGIGYKAVLKKNLLILELGFSHEIVYRIPEGIHLTITKPLGIIIFGVDQELVTLMAAHIRAFKKPEPYKGGGVRYFNERLRRKEGKKIQQ